MLPSCVRCFIYYVLGVTVYAKFVITTNIETSGSAFFLPIYCNKAIMEQSGKRYGADVGIPDAEQ